MRQPWYFRVQQKCFLRASPVVTQNFKKACIHGSKFNKIYNFYCLIKGILKCDCLPTSPILVSARQCRIQWWQGQFGTTAFIHTKAPAVLPTIAFADGCQQWKKAISWYYYKNSFNLADAWKGLAKHILRTAALNSNNKRGLLYVQEEDKHNCRTFRINAKYVF